MCVKSYECYFEYRKGVDQDMANYQVTGLLCFILFHVPYIALSNLESHAGWVVSTTLAGATVGSFTGGTLADKLGRIRTFQLDAIPLVIGAFLRFRYRHNCIM